MSGASRVSLRASLALVSILMLIGSNLSPVKAGGGPVTATTWTDSHATFYGGDDASGTIGGACGYGNLYNTGYGQSSTALSETLFNSGESCGACFEIKCIVSQSKWCYPDATSVKVTATNLCPPNWARTTDGWCNPPRTHFDLSYPMFERLAQKVGGIIPIQFRRIPCVKQGGIRFNIQGNPWFNLVLVFNVGGAGDVTVLEMKGSKTDFYTMTRNWGEIWQLKEVLTGQALSFQVTLSDNTKLTSDDIAPANWYFGQSFECTQNF